MLQAAVAEAEMQNDWVTIERLLHIEEILTRMEQGCLERLPKLDDALSE